MKRSKKLLLGFIISLCCISCIDKNEYSVRVNIEDFLHTESLEGTDIELDTIPGICASVVPVDSLYFCYLFKSDNYLMVTDRDFNILGYTAHIGAGPGDVSQISFLYGKILKNVEMAVLDVNKSEVLGCNLGNWGLLTPRLGASSLAGLPAPLYLLQLNNGNYLSAPLDYEYGLYSLDITDGRVEEWPVGIDLPDDKKYAITSSRWVSYNPSKDIVVEYYSVLPILILHNADGEVIKHIQFGDMPKFDDINENSPFLIADICLTDKYIFILLENNDQSDLLDEVSVILATDYDGRPVGSFTIKAATSISIDASCKRLIGVNPNAEHNITVYDLPHWLKL